MVLNQWITSTSKDNITDSMMGKHPVIRMEHAHTHTHTGRYGQMALQTEHREIDPLLA